MKDKSLSPPEVVQALLDGRKVSMKEVGTFNEAVYRIDAHSLERYRGGTLCKDPSAMFVSELLAARNVTWSLAPDTYDWTEARKRMAAGKRVRRADVTTADVRFYECRLSGDSYLDGSNQSYEFRSSDFDATDWEDA